VLVVILVEVEAQQLGYPQPCAQQYLKDGQVAEWPLVSPPLQEYEVLGGGFQPGDFDGRQTFPFRIVHANVANPFSWVSGKKRSATVNPPGTVPKRCQHAVGRGGAAFFVLQTLDEIAGD
jgi:hypothetical protein